MSLFPAYASESDDVGPPAKIPRKDLAVEDYTQTDFCENSGDAEVANISEEQLLDSDSEHEPAPEPAQQYLPSLPTVPEDYYEDKKLDRANIGVSTLYTPGRPLYTYTDEMVGIASSKKSSKHKTKRYYQAAKKLVDIVLEPQALLRNEVSLLEKAIHQNPQNLKIWNKYLDYQMQRGEAALLSALELADTMKISQGPLLPRLLRISQLVRPAREHLQILRDLLATNDGSWSHRGSVWALLVVAVCNSAECSAPAVRRVCASAAANLTRPRDYLTVLYLYGCFLANAGLWETLVRLIELLAAMNLTPLPEIPQPTVDFTEQEDKICSSGLPLDTVWRRIETLRASAYWRPSNNANEVGLDPQRAVQSSDVADLLLPVVNTHDTFVLAANIFRWVGVPLLPPLLGDSSLSYKLLHGPLAPECISARGLRTEAVLFTELARADLGFTIVKDDCGGAALLATLAEPPDNFTDQFGYMSWSRTVCDSVCSSLSACPSARTALLCVRLRYMRALALMAEEEERVRMYKLARQLLKDSESPATIAAAEYALVQAAGRPDPTSSAGKVAVLAMRTAISDIETTAVDRIYVARIVGRIFGEKSNTSRWALVCAVLGKTLPSNLDEPPPKDFIRSATTLCEERCTSIESEISSQLADDEEHILEPWWSLVPGEEQWALARSVLNHATCPQEWAESTNLRAVRYHHAVSVGGRVASMFAAHPYDFTLATLWGSQKWWRRLVSVSPSPLVALADILPHAREAAARHWPPHLSALCVRVCTRAMRAAGTSSVGGAQCKAAALRGAGERAGFYKDIDMHPGHKCVYVSGSWCGLAREAADLLLEKQLRLHALPDELVPL